VIANTKFLLYYFENISCLRINYHKSEVMVVGANEGEEVIIANMLNCKVGSLSVTPHVSKPHDYVNHMFMRP
jgi:hypothetical protein